MKRKPKFEVGDVLEVVTVRRFTVGIIGLYYGEPLYCADENDCGTPESAVRLSKGRNQMTKPDDDGGPSFPVPTDYLRQDDTGHFQILCKGGMSKWEYFYAHAPERPDWFGPAGVDGYENLYFTWRRYYATKMVMGLKPSEAKHGK